MIRRLSTAFVLLIAVVAAFAVTGADDGGSDRDDVQERDHYSYPSSPMRSSPIPK